MEQLWTWTWGGIALLNAWRRPMIAALGTAPGCASQAHPASLDWFRLRLSLRLNEGLAAQLPGGVFPFATPSENQIQAPPCLLALLIAASVDADASHVQRAT